ncbi:hypothetical protein CR983_00615 [Candidatus Saccharibacteria bacterium]|nr:MAG: hypothetical protein CR983_00615 [Candidatus Saccharibacteria bacterium]
MSDDAEHSSDKAVLVPHEQAVSQFAKHRLAALVIGAIVIACTTTFISLWLYRVSGTVQLDLSLPEYENVRDQITEEDDRVFSQDGPVDTEALTTFRQVYDDHLKSIVGLDGFRPEALNDDALELGDVFDEE